MQSGATPFPDWPRLATAPRPEQVHTPTFGPGMVLSVAAGFFTAFTVSLVGEMPVGEIVLFLVAGWAGLCAILHQAVPGPLFHERMFRTLMISQAIALAGYVIADVAWRSALLDVARGWSRMIFLAIDLVAFTYLFGRSPRNFLWFLGGRLVGDVAQAMIFGALFGDTWKFGIGVPLTFAAIYLASFGGPFLVVLVALAFGALHFVLDFRSVGGLCVGLAAFAAIQLLPIGWRKMAVPLGVILALSLVVTIYSTTRRDDDPHRASRSDVDRSSMIRAATEAFVHSPLIGHGSWFSRSHVYDNFLQIRDDAAKEADIGGFIGPNEEPEPVALHSQILVALAEGGLLGGAFFIVFGADIVRALYCQAMTETWVRSNAVRILALLFAAWNLWMSPFSGAHRVNIAMVAGLLLLMPPVHRPDETA
ncbi:MAG TPA: O-antigen ligase family protein [Candidatus Didemnitutus sp.]|nr:O-antigen ligase family protein [Candidatus Didemnitutus sp.]